MVAIAEIKGGQYLVKKGDIVQVQKMDDEEGKKVKLDAVLLTIDGANVTVGTPYVKGASIELLVKKHYRGEKLRGFKMKAKKRYARTYGHRQWYTDVEVVSIG